MALFEHKYNREYIFVAKELLKHMPNDNKVLSKYITSLIAVGKLEKALKQTYRLEKVAKNGMFKHYIHRMKIYRRLRDEQNYLKTYKQLFNQPRDLLAYQQNTYSYLLSFALSHQTLHNDVPIIHKLYNKYNGYECSIEKQILRFYNYTNKSILANQIIENDRINKRHCFKD